MITVLTVAGMFIASILTGLYCIGVVVNLFDRLDEGRPLVACLNLALIWPLYFAVTYESRRRAGL